jgi:hypothetical protein
MLPGQVDNLVHMLLFDLLMPSLALQLAPSCLQPGRCYFGEDDE